MDSNRWWCRWLADCTRWSDEQLPGVPVVEIAGAKRVLVERHRGVRQYSEELVEVILSYGVLSVRGQQLILKYMSREQLVITGQIQDLHIDGGRS